MDDGVSALFHGYSDGRRNLNGLTVGLTLHDHQAGTYGRIRRCSKYDCRFGLARRDTGGRGGHLRLETVQFGA